MADARLLRYVGLLVGPELMHGKGRRNVGL